MKGSRRKAYLRGAVVTAAVWAPAGGLAWLMLRTMAQRGEIAVADDVKALEIGVFALVLFLASGLGALVAGHREPGYDDAPSLTFSLALLAPLTVCAIALLLGTQVLDAVERTTGWALLGAALVGGCGGAVIARLRQHDEDETFYDRARRRQVDRRATGWRSG